MLHEAVSLQLATQQTLHCHLPKNSRSILLLQTEMQQNVALQVARRNKTLRDKLLRVTY